MQCNINMHTMTKSLCQFIIHTFSSILVISLLITSTVQGSRHYYLPPEKEATDILTYYSPSSDMILSSHPSTALSNHPSNIPTIAPTVVPTLSPSSEATSQPSFQPSFQPSVLPSTVQSSEPSHGFSSAPSQFPTTTITSFTSASPSTEPSSKLDNVSNFESCDMSTKHLIGSQTSNAINISYKYRMEYMRLYEWKNITTKIEEVLNVELARVKGYLGCKLPQKEVMLELMTTKEINTNASQTLNLNHDDVYDVFSSNVLGLSSKPSDAIIDDETCYGNTKQFNTFQCNVFTGHLSIYLRDSVNSSDNPRKLFMAKNEAFYNITLEMIKMKMNGPSLKASHDAIVSLQYVDEDKDIFGEDAYYDDVPQIDKTKTAPFSFAWLFLAAGSVVVSGGIATLLNFGLHRKVDLESIGSGSEHCSYNDNDLAGSQESVETFQASNLNIPSTDTDTLLGLPDVDGVNESLSTLAREESISTLVGQASESSSPSGRQSNDENSESTLVFAF